MRGGVRKKGKNLPLEKHAINFSFLSKSFEHDSLPQATRRFFLSPQLQRRRCRRRPKRSRADTTATASGQTTTTVTANHRDRRARQQRGQGVGRRRANERSVNHGLIDGSSRERRRRRRHRIRRRHRRYRTRPRDDDTADRGYRPLDERCRSGTETRRSETRTNNRPTVRNSTD